MLVCLAALLFVRLGQLLIADSAARFPGAYLRTDPTRLIEAIAVGISFIGAGTIFRDSNDPRKRGLTTAASLLTTAPIGIAIALNRYIVAIGVTLLGLFILHTLRRLEIALFRLRNLRTNAKHPRRQCGRRDAFHSANFRSRPAAKAIYEITRARSR